MSDLSRNIAGRLPAAVLGLWVTLAAPAWARKEPPTPTPTPNPTAQALFEKSQKAFREKRYRDAKDGLMQFVAKYPMENAIPQSRLILAELEQDFEVSVMQFKVLAQEYSHRKEGSEALKNLGARYYLADRYDEAVATYREYLKSYPKSPDEPEVHYWLGASLAALGDEKHAIGEFDKSIKRDPEGKWAPKSYLALGNAYLKETKYDNAKRQYLKILDRYPMCEELNQVYLKLGRTYEALNRPQEAHAAYATLLSRYAKSIEAPEAQERCRDLETRNPQLAAQAVVMTPTTVPTPADQIRPTPGPSPTGTPEAESFQGDPTPVPTAGMADKPTPIPVQVRVDSSNPFRVQVGVFTKRAYADQTIQKLHKAGYRAEVVEVKNPDTTFTTLKVRLGHYPDRETARKTSLEVKRRSGIPAIVVEE